VERFIKLGNFNARFDLFGFIDIVALLYGETFGIQATTASNVPSRIAKIRGYREAKIWLAAGNRVQVWGWKKVLKKKGGKATVWIPRIVEVELEVLKHENQDDTGNHC